MNTVNTSVIDFIQGIGCGIFGETLFFGRVPNSNKVDTKLWWLIPTGGRPSKHNVTGEDTLAYEYDIKFRDIDLRAVEQEMFRITKEITGAHCYNLDDFTTINIELSSIPRYDEDIEGRVHGTLSFRVTVYDILKPAN